LSISNRFHHEFNKINSSCLRAGKHNEEGSDGMGYIEELRALVGTRPLILAGVAVLIIDRHNRFLMVQSDQQWKLPGGFIELGESAEEACRREIWEETGVRIGHLELIGVLSGKEYFTKLANGDEYFPITIAYVTQDIRSGQPKPDKIETQKVQFFQWPAVPHHLSKRDQEIFERFMKQQLLEGKKGWKE
jgi:ADP-ribose pyrophosphatase YjhB (NUDIX family)